MPIPEVTMATISRVPNGDSSTESVDISENEVSIESANENHATTDSMPRSSLQTSAALVRLSGSHPQLPNIEPHQHSTLFYLSLIEGRCRTQAAGVLNKRRLPHERLPEHHPEVHSLAQHLFGEMTKELHRAGVLPDEFSGQELSELRGSYLSSFDSILHNIAAKKTNEVPENDTYSSLFERPTSFALDADLLSTSLTNPRAFVLQKYKMVPGMVSRLRSLSIQDTNYKTMYKERCLLGKGGFGKVYKSYHILDGRDYAIKKVVMRVGGNVHAESKAKEMHSEVQALSGMNHRNIVRYHHCWVEKVLAELPGDSSSGSESEEETDEVVAKLRSVKHMKAGPSSTSRNVTRQLARESRHLRQVSRMVGESEDNIVFARSASVTPGKNKAMIPDQKSFFRSPGSPDDSDSDNGTDSEKSVDNEYSADNGYSTEEIPRNTEIVHSSAVFDIVLFIQMSLHPMNLEDYLWPEQQKPQDTKVEHCYHSLPTARLLMAILDGVDYIHRNKIVHRDLKPSNIMLSISDDAISMLDGSINVSDCPDCAAKAYKGLYITPHIGDFGLVAEMQDPEVSKPSLSFEAPDPPTDPSPSGLPPTALNPNAKFTSELSTEGRLAMIPARSSPGLSSCQPGTRFYVAPKSSNGKPVVCPRVDVYSLGVIAFEMIYKFKTRTERVFELEKLKDSIFPKGFENHVMADGIKNMLAKDREQRWGCAEVRKWLDTIIEAKSELLKTDHA